MWHKGYSVCLFLHGNYCNENCSTTVKYLFEQLPNINLTDKEKLDQLLPWSITIPEECRVPNKAK